jgi:tetratricopeptide (TPR) repeat protein
MKTEMSEAPAGKGRARVVLSSAKAAVPKKLAVKTSPANEERKEDSAPVRSARVPGAKKGAKQAGVTTRAAQAAMPESSQPASASSLPSASASLGLTVALAIGTEKGVILMGTSSAQQAKIAVMGPVELEPSPHVIPLSGQDKGGVLESDVKSYPSGIVRRYVTFLPMSLPAEASKRRFGAILESRANTVVQTVVQPYAMLKVALLQKAVKQFAPLLESVISAALPAAHPLRKALAGMVPQGAIATAPAARASTFSGSFDSVTDAIATGWALDMANPAQRAVVEILDGTRVVARGPADEFRQDLLEAGLGDGKCMFNLKLSSELRDGAVHRLIARVANSPAGFGNAQEYKVRSSVAQKVDVIVYEDTKRLATVLHQSATLKGTKDGNVLQDVIDANLLLETGAFNQAENRFNELIGLYGEHALLLCKLGESFLLRQRPVEAQQAYEKALSQDSMSADAWLGIGNCHVLRGEWAEAEAACNRALQIAPGLARARNRIRLISRDALIERAENMVEKGDVDGAIDIFKSQLLRDPENERLTSRLLEAVTLKNQRRNTSRVTRLTEKFSNNKYLLDLFLDEAEAYLHRAAK